MTLLSEVIGNTDRLIEVRMLAGIALKNELTAKDPRTRAFQKERWIQLPQDVKQQIRAIVSCSLIYFDFCGV